jgi:hypothetical protein
MAELGEPISLDAQGSPIEHAVTYHWVERYPYRMRLYRSDGAR